MFIIFLSSLRGGRGKVLGGGGGSAEVKNTKNQYHEYLCGWYLLYWLLWNIAFIAAKIRRILRFRETCRQFRPRWNPIV